jgi:hypothetical protein
MITAICAECRKPYQTYPRTLRRVKSPTCSRQCNGKARGRDWATHGYKGPMAKGTPPPVMRGPANPAWKGGVTLKRPKGNYTGVRYVRCPLAFLPMARADGYIMEHRLVMAQWVGRLLLRTEVVNHKDHDPSNNARSNLELWPTNGDHKRGEVGRFVDGVANRLYLAA